MEIIKELKELQPEMQTWRRDIHSHPEIAFEEHRTAKIVADKLEVSEDAGGNGYRLITNAGKDSHQEVPHLHFHLVAGKPLGPLLVK